MANRNYIPTPEEIEKACAKIREEWSERKWADQEKRKGWDTPVIKTPKIK
jgi:hypothetical protein